MTKKEKYYLFKTCRKYRIVFDEYKLKYGLDDKLTSAVQGKYYAIAQLIVDLKLIDQFNTWDKICNEIWRAK